MARTVSWILFLALAGLFVLATAQLSKHARIFPEQDIQVVLPRFVQVIASGGDRYLAANVAVIRSLLNPTAKDSYEHYAAQARIQEDAAWFNPRHEDNYYIAAALLSWSGHVKSAETILERAALGRPFDMLPPFFLGFDYYHFDQNPALGAHWMYEAAGRADEGMRISLSRIASRWAERGDDPREAINFVKLMRDSARGHALKQYLNARVQRLEGVIALQDAAVVFRSRYGKPPEQMTDLVRTGILNTIPGDPFGLGYRLDEAGVPQLNQPQPAATPANPPRPAIK